MNPHLATMHSDFLYHLGIEINTKDTSDIERRFGDVQVICMGGTKSRMQEFAEHIQNELFPQNKDELVDLCEHAQRYAVYKVGPVLSCSHGLGMSSFSVILHEIIKLTWYAKCKDPLFIRMGTSGGLGVEPGTVVISKDAFNGLLRSEHTVFVLGAAITRPATFNESLLNELLKCAQPTDDFKTIVGNTLAAECFYEGQARIDGAVCDYTEEDKMQFLKKCHHLGIRNIEMEATMFAALTLKAGVRAADICVTLINRLNGDQVQLTTKCKASFEERPRMIITRYIKKLLKL